MGRKNFRLFFPSLFLWRHLLRHNKCSPPPPALSRLACRSRSPTTRSGSSFQTGSCCPPRKRRLVQRSAASCPRLRSLPFLPPKLFTTTLLSLPTTLTSRRTTRRLHPSRLLSLLLLLKGWTTSSLWERVSRRRKTFAYVWSNSTRSSTSRAVRSRTAHVVGGRRRT